MVGIEDVAVDALEFGDLLVLGGDSAAEGVRWCNPVTYSRACLAS
jgi:hypothetical protein